MNNSKIDTDFSKLSPSAWKQMIQFQLEGGDYAKQMIFHSLEGIDIKPFYTEEDVKNPINFPKTNWSIEEQIAVYDDEKASKIACEAIEFGAESIHFINLNPSTDFKVLIKGIDLNKIKVRISLQQLSEELISRIESNDLRSVIFCIDPISKLYATANWYKNQKSDFELLLSFLSLSEKGFSIHLEVDNYTIAEAGANSAYQLSLVMGHLAEYLLFLETKDKLSLIKFIHINIGVGSNYFFEIAKARALRILIPSLLNEFDLKTDFTISSHTISRYYTAYNSVQNLVRSSSSLLSSILSTADNISGLNHDSLINFPNSNSSRLIRNQLLLLKHETGLNNYQDAANGSYYINYLTDQLAQKALLGFKQLENNAGMITQLKKGSIQKEIKSQHLKEFSLYNENKEILIGANAYKEKKERLKKVAQRKPFMKRKSRKTLIIPILKRRVAEAWEEKRWNNE